MQDDFPQSIDSAEAMSALGERIATQLKPGDVLALIGDLGAGKTQLTKGILQGLDYTKPVTSPTFTIVQEYRGGTLDVVHFDLYRLSSAQDLLEIGWEDYLDQPQVLVVEWADRLPECMPAGTHCLSIEHTPEGRLVHYAPLD